MPKYQGAIADVDVHHRWKTDAEIAAYLPKEWQTFVAGNGRERYPIYPPGSDAAPIPFDSRRADAIPEDGSSAGSSFEMLRTQLLDPHGYYRALLVHDVGQFATHLNPYYAIALCRAVNDWNLDTWMKLDERLYSVVVAPFATPDEAVQEIRRIGAHPRISGVLLAGNPLDAQSATPSSIQSGRPSPTWTSR